MTNLSRERREELERQVQTEDGWTKYGQIPIGCGELRALLSDSAWRERVERQVRELAEHYELLEDESPDFVVVANKLRAIVDTGRGRARLV